MKLNIACGGTKKYPFKNLNCEINCDLVKPSIKVKNFVLCDAYHLPFKDKIFSHIFAFHLIEHLNSPKSFLAECKRIGVDCVYIETPNVYSKNSFRDLSHVQHYSFFTLQQTMQEYFTNVHIVGRGGFWIPFLGYNRFAKKFIKMPFIQRLVFVADCLLAKGNCS